MEEQGLSKFLTVEVHEKIYQEKHYAKRGRPTAKTPYYLETIVEMSCRVDRQEAAIEAHQQLMGWRIYVTNTAKTRMTLTQSVRYYRDEYTVERGFHRFKQGSLPILPLFLRIDERIRGLVFLLFIALQVLTLIEFIVRRELAKTDENLAGLVPGNPKNVQTQPTAERLLAAFKELNLFIQRQGDDIVGHLVEKLSPLQEKILSLLNIPKEIYNLSFIKVRTDGEVDRVETNFDLAIAA
ncbi:MAG: transposase [Candidatus Competibacteraceae bacterium]|nr:transposase [Candidatus Competibacteraceae bacterium]